MSMVFNPSRLTLARHKLGLTMIELAEQIGIAWRTVAAYESDKGGNGRDPKPETVSKLSKVLGFPPAFFYGTTLEEPPIEGSSFRSLSSLTRRHKAKGFAAGTLAMYLSDWIATHYEVPEPAIPEYSGVDSEAAAMAVREEWGLGERPIRNMVHLLEFHGVRIFSLAEDIVQLDAYSFWRDDVPYIFLNTLKSAEHSRLDAAHELGHLVLHRNDYTKGKRIEQEANDFGSALLMPRGSLVANAPRRATLANLIAAKRFWNVSVSALAYRMHKQGLLSDWLYRTIFIQISKNHYRVNEPNSAQRETSQVLAKVFHGLLEDGVSMADVAQELSLSLDELSKLVFGLVLTPLLGGRLVAEQGTYN